MTRQITLQDIYTVVNRLEDKMDERLTKVESKVDGLENIASKAMIIFGLISTIGTALFTWIWGKITKNI